MKQARASVPPSSRIPGSGIVPDRDALRTERRYHKAWPREKVVQYIRDNAGISFGPNLVDIFLANVDKGQDS